MNLIRLFVVVVTMFGLTACAQITFGPSSGAIPSGGNFAPTVPSAGTMDPAAVSTSAPMSPTVAQLMLVLDEFKAQLEEQRILTAQLMPFLVAVTNVATATNLTYTVTTATNAVPVVTTTTNITYQLPLSATNALAQVSTNASPQPVTIPAIPQTATGGTRTRMRYGDIHGNVEINIGGNYGKVEGQLPSRSRARP